MKILLIDVNCKNSSTGKIVYDLHNQLIKDGHLSAICYGRGEEVKEPYIWKFSTNIEVYIHALLTRLTGLTSCYSFFSTKKLTKIINKFKPDIVHLHDLHGYFVNIIPLLNFLKNNKIRTVWTFHCEFMFTGRCGYAYDCNNWKKDCGNCPDISEYPESWFFDISRKMLKDKRETFKDFNNLLIVTPSNWLKKRVGESFLKNKKIKVIHNGIDIINIFYPRDYKHLKIKYKLTNEKIVLAVAPDIMNDRKGGKHVNELAKRFLKKNVIFIMIGVQKSDYKFSQNVIILPRTNNQIELAEYYSMADVFVICSKRENFPTVCIESLACGTPVCGFNEGGTAETALGEMGKFVKYGDIDALQNKITEMLEKEKNSKDCHEYAKTNYSKEKMYERYIKLYKKVFSCL